MLIYTLHWPSLFHHFKIERKNQNFLLFKRIVLCVLSDRSCDWHSELQPREINYKIKPFSFHYFLRKKEKNFLICSCLRESSYACSATGRNTSTKPTTLFELHCPIKIKHTINSLAKTFLPLPLSFEHWSLKKQNIIRVSHSNSGIINGMKM